MARRGCLRKEGGQFGVFDAEILMLRQRMDALERKAQAYSDSKWRWMSKIDSVVEWMSWLGAIGHLLSFLLCFALYAYYGEIGGEKCAFFGEKAVADGWPKDLAPRIIVGVLRIFILYAFVAGIVVLFLYACVQFFFYFIKFIVHLIFFIIRGCIFVHLVFLRVYSYRIFPIFFNFFQKKYTERQIDVLLRRPVAADSSNLVLFNTS